MKPDKIPAHLLRYPAEDYLSCDPYWGDEEDVQCRTFSIVRTRNDVECTMGLCGRSVQEATHKAGSVVWKETGLIDGKFQTNCVCLPHIAITLDYNYGGTRDPYEFSCQEAAVYTPEPEEE